MKDYKLKIIDALVAEAQDARIVELKKIAQSVGVDRLSRQEAEEVLRAAVKQLPDYKIVQIVNEKQMNNPASASLWETGALVEKTFSLEDVDQ